MSLLITNPRNPRLQAVHRLHRRRERDLTGRFLAEGEDLIEAAERAGRPALEGYRLAGSGIGGAAFVDVSADALKRVCALSSGSRAIGVYEQRWEPRPSGPLCLYLHRVSDPGNVGAAMRSAAAFGASCVALSRGCADPHSPKSVRASMGAIFHQPIARCDSIAELPGERLALVAGQGVPLRDIEAGSHPVGSPLSILLGAERDGLPAEIVAGCEHVAHIPIRTDSLNAAMAATVALYALGGDSNRVPSSC